MDRRDVLRWLSLSSGAAAGLAGMGAQHAGAAQAEPKKPDPPRGLPPLKITDIRTILTAPDRIRLVIVKVLDQRAGPVRPGLRHVHPARARGADGGREVPQALPARPRRRPDRGHLAVVLRQLVLAERAGPVQRHERRGHGALGHQGQAGQHARLSASGRQVPVRRRALRPRPRARFQGGRGQRPPGDGQGLPPRSRPGGDPRPGDLRHRSGAIRAGRSGGARPDQSQVHLGARAVPAHSPQAVRAPAVDPGRRGRAAARRSRADLAEPGRRLCARSWRSITCSSSRTRFRPRRKTTSG